MGRFVPSNAPPKSKPGAKIKSSKTVDSTDDDMDPLEWVVLRCGYSLDIDFSLLLFIFRASEEEAEAEDSEAEEMAVDRVKDLYVQ
jgi:hypothetical protein